MIARVFGATKMLAEALLAIGLVACSPAAGTIRPSPSTPTSAVEVPLDATRSIEVVMRDGSGLLRAGRAATASEVEELPSGIALTDVMAFNPDGTAGDEIRLRWGGSICDKTATIDIGAGVRSITITPGPVGACDAMNVGRGVVLTFAAPVDARQITVTVTSG